VTALDQVDTPTGRALTWQPAVQFAGWVPDAAHAVKVTRTFRFYGANAADRFLRYDEGTMSGGKWTSVPRWVNTAIDFTFPSSATNYPLDAKYEDLKPGQQLLVNT